MMTKGAVKNNIEQDIWMNLSRIVVGMVLLLSGCAPVKAPTVVETPPVLVKLSPSAYPALSDDLNYEGLNHCILMSLTYLRKLPRDRTFAFGTDSYTAAHLIRSLEVFQEFIQTRPSVGRINEMVRRDFLVYRAAGASEKVLFTGYYEPLLKGSIKETALYHYPIYSRPDDLVTVDLSAFSAKYAGETITGRYTGQTLVPYYDRKAIENREIFKGQALAWVGDPVDLFFLHIQGSGKILLDQGKTLNVHYHATNGHPYRSIGKVLIDQGKISRSEISMQAIRAYLKSHPQEQETILSANPSYVFFKTETDGPLGNLNVPLTPGRSIAVDKKIFPPAALMYIQTQKPVMTEAGQLGTWEEFGRFALNQDTGGAITGPGRADIFWGNGPYAELAAGYLQHRGDMYFLILKPTVSP